jgi:hypothetical protein
LCQGLPLLHPTWYCLKNLDPLIIKDNVKDKICSSEGSSPSECQYTQRHSTLKGENTLQWPPLGHFWVKYYSTYNTIVPKIWYI